MLAPHDWVGIIADWAVATDSGRYAAVDATPDRENDAADDKDGVGSQGSNGSRDGLEVSVIHYADFFEGWRVANKIALPYKRAVFEKKEKEH
jgi:hypothetical protein